MSDKPSIALGSLGLGAAALIGCLQTPFVPWFVGVPSLVAGSTITVGIGARHRKHGLSLNDYGEGLSQFFDDVEEVLTPLVEWTEKKTDPVINQVVVGKMPGFAQYLVSAGDAERDDSWLTDSMIKASKIVLGVKGSGKTTWLRYEVRRWLAACPEGTIRVVDLHHAEESPEWLPGIDPEDYLATTASEALAVVREMRAIGDKRIASKTHKHPPHKIVLDEFEGILLRLSEDEQEEIIEAIRFCENELRKYNVTSTITFKSPKKENVRLDSSTIAQMDWLMLGKSLADSTVKWPADLDVKGLLQERSKVAALPGCQYACVYREQSEDAVIKVIPTDLAERTEAIQFKSAGELSEFDQWLETNRAEIESRLQAGESRTSISKVLGIKRDKDNPQWQAIAQIETELKVKTEETVCG